MLKIVYPVCCGMDVHKSFVVACVASTNDHGVTTVLPHGCTRIPARMSVWSPPENTGFPSTTSLNHRAGSPSHIPST